MHEHDHLHESEHLLFAAAPSRARLLTSWLRGLVDTLVVGTALAVVVTGLMLLTKSALSYPWYIVLFVLVLIAIGVRRWVLWKRSIFRITTERILIEHDSGLFIHPMRTIKWSQFQESYVGHSNIIDMLFRVHPLCIRYGAADSQLIACFPALRRTEDLKHYIDKVDSLLRTGRHMEVRPFIAKPRGQRDV